MRRYRIGDSPEQLEDALDGLQEIAETDDVIKVPEWQTVVSAGAIGLTNNTPVFWYLQRLKKAIKQVEISFKVTTAAVGVTWAELAIYTAQYSALNTAFTFKRLGYVDIAAEVVGLGNYRKKITLSENKTGMDIWAAVGSVVTTTAPQFRSSYPDEMQNGYHQTSTGRLSTNASLVGVLAAGTLGIPWMPYRIVV